MTQNMHIFIAFIILFILWHLLLKKHFFIQKEADFWQEYFKDKFF